MSPGGIIANLPLNLSASSNRANRGNRDLPEAERRTRPTGSVTRSTRGPLYNQENRKTNSIRGQKSEYPYGYCALRRPLASTRTQGALSRSQELRGESTVAVYLGVSTGIQDLTGHEARVAQLAPGDSPRRPSRSGQGRDPRGTSARRPSTPRSGRKKHITRSERSVGRSDARLGIRLGRSRRARARAPTKLPQSPSRRARFGSIDTLEEGWPRVGSTAGGG